MHYFLKRKLIKEKERVIVGVGFEKSALMKRYSGQLDQKAQEERREKVAKIRENKKPSKKERIEVMELETKINEIEGVNQRLMKADHIIKEFTSIRDEIKLNLWK